MDSRKRYGDQGANSGNLWFAPHVMTEGRGDQSQDAAADKLVDGMLEPVQDQAQPSQSLDEPLETAKSQYDEFLQPMPELIDDELAQALAERAVRERQRFTWGVRGWIWITCLLGLICGFMRMQFLVDTIFGTAIFAFVAITIAGYILEKRLTKAIDRRHYDEANRAAPQAIEFNTVCIPFTYIQFANCINSYFTLLIVEGRHVEFEAWARYGWAYYENKEVYTGIPKHWTIANNLAVALLSQKRYPEARELLEAIEHKTRLNLEKQCVFNNLALCMLKEKKIEKAEEYLAKAFKTGVKLKSPFGARIHLVKAMVEIEKDELESAESRILSIQEYVGKTEETVELAADCFASLGEIRFRQDRLDEAILYYKNSIDIMELAANPPYAQLAANYAELARIDDAQGNLEAADKKMERARKYWNTHLERDLDAIAAIKERLADPKKIAIGSQLFEKSARYPLLPDHLFHSNESEET